MAKVIKTESGWIVEYDGKQYGGIYPDMWEAMSASPFFDFIIVH